MKIQVCHKQQSALISTGVNVAVNQWDESLAEVVNHMGGDQLNMYLKRMLYGAQAVLLDVMSSGELCTMSLSQLRDRIMAAVNPSAKVKRDKSLLFANRFRRFAESRPKKGTQEIYLHTLSRIEDFCPGIHSMRFEDITHQWLREFDAWMAKTMCINSRSIHMRNIRAVFNDAITDEVTTAYPFRKFKIKNEATRKRSLSLEQLREFLVVDVEPWQEEFRDWFKLIFMLVGINAVDLCALDSLHGDRIEYRRAKTGRLYDIKVEPEAMEIIDKYRGKSHLLNITERWGNYEDWLHKIDRNLKWLGGITYQKRTAKDGKQRIVAVREARWPGLSTYWARHTWATIAASLDIPKETIAHALGHGGNTITDIYIDFDQCKVDDANRKVIDWVLYEKR